MDEQTIYRPSRQQLKGWRRWLTGYGAALVMTMSFFAPPPVPSLPPPAAIVRLTARRQAGEFDPRERGGAFVLTVPLGPGRERLWTGQPTITPN